MRVALLTHGCRLNQSESDAIASDFVAAGHEVAADPAGADLLIVNTCTVTQAADREGRRLARHWARTLGSGRVVVAGCSAQRDPRPYAMIPGVRLVTGNDGKHRLLALLEEDGPALRVEPPPARPSARLVELRARGFSSHARAYLRAQDGCNQSCTFCTLPAVRGKSASVPVAVVRAEAATLAAAGHRELVLTGAHLGSYGLDLAPRVPLSALIEEVLEAAPGCRVRLSSLEPRAVTPPLLDLLAREERICPHLHLPLQSGDDRVLRRMQRAYDVASYVRRIEAAAESLRHRLGDAPGMALGSDFIVGFPGEDDRAFGATLDLVERLPFTYGHVFTYSDRPGTAAAALAERVPPPVARRRHDALVALLAHKAERFRSAHAGFEIEIVAERIEGGDAFGTTERFVTARVAAVAARTRERVRARVVGVEGVALRARAISGRDQREADSSRATMVP